MIVTFNEIKEQILAVYPDAKIYQRLYNFDYLAGIEIKLGNDNYLFFRREPDPAEDYPLNAEKEESPYLQAFTPDKYPSDMALLILYTLKNKITIRHSFIKKQTPNVHMAGK